MSCGNCQGHCAEVAVVLVGLGARSLRARSDSPRGRITYSERAPKSLLASATRADLDGIVDIVDEDLAVSDVPGAGTH